MPWHPGWHPAASNMHDARQHQAERGRGLPGLWSLRNLGALEAGRMAARGSDSRVLVRDEAWKVAPKSIELEAGRLAGGGVSPPGAQAYASPSHLYLIRVGPPTCSKQGGALRAGAVALETSLAVPGSTWERPSAKTQQPPSQVKPACTQEAARRSEAQNCAALISNPHSLTHSPPTPLTYSASSRSPAQLDQSRARKTRRGQPSPLRPSPLLLLLLHSQRPTSHFHISIHSREMHCCCHRYPSRAVRVLNLYLL